MHARKGLYTLCAGKHGSRYKTNFISLSSRFPNFDASNAWQMGHNSPEGIFLGQELLFGFAAWLDLTLITRLRYISCLQSFRTHFDSLKRADDLRVYRGYMMPLNHQAGIQGTLK